MTIGIDISQIVYQGTGVARYVEEVVRELVDFDTKNRYVLFATTIRRRSVLEEFFTSLSDSAKQKTVLKVFPLPSTFLEFIWNRLHVIPIEWIIGNVDIFWSSDWTQPPLVRAKGITTIHDVSIFRFPESFPEKIVSVHKRKLHRSKAICSHFLCDSEATKKDANSFLQIPLEKMSVVYPGYTLL